MSIETKRVLVHLTFLCIMIKVISTFSDEIRYDEEKRTVPFMGRPETAVTSENTVNRHAKQRGH